MEKNSKILIWPRTNMLFFGLARSLKKQLNSKLFLIVNDQHISKDFFEKQKIVEYEKIWHYDDYTFQKLQKPDLKYLSKIETQCNVNLWNIVYGDRIFYGYNNFHNFNRNEILSILQYDCKFFESIIDEIKPDFLIMDITAFHEDLILYNIAKSRGIKILTLSDTRFPSRAMVCDKFDKIDDEPDNLYDVPIEIEKTLEQLQQITKDYVNYHQDFINHFRSSIFQRFKAGIRFLLFVNNKKYTQHYPNFGKNKLRILYKQISFLFLRSIRQFFLKQNSLSKIPNNQKFIYFPLHGEPERTLLYGAPFYTNQLEVITNVAKSIPVDYKLIVKDHPIQKSNGWRPISFYKKIKKLPNVELINPEFSGDELLEKCSLVVTIGGTVGLNAAFYLKPTIIFSDVLYASLPSVEYVKNLNELPEKIRNSLKNQVKISDLNKFVNFVDENTFIFNYYPIDIDLVNSIYYGGFTSSANFNESYIKNILDRHNDSFDFLASAFIKKINFYLK
jgi:hypothetical protein